jgi:hypothetical protein
MAEITSQQLNELTSVLNALKDTLDKRSPSASSGSPNLSGLGDQSQIANGIAQSIAGATNEVDKLSESLTFLDSMFSGFTDSAGSFVDTIKSFVGSIPGMDIVFGVLKEGANLVLTNLN